MKTYSERTDMVRTLWRSGGYLAAIMLLHTAAMMVWERMTAGDAAWLTATTIVTVGYGDYYAATTAGRLATVLLIYVGGIFVVFQTAADYFEYRTQRHQKMVRGEWRWHMRDHILLINSPSINPERYFVRLVEEIRGNRCFADTPVQILSSRFGDGLPAALRELDVIHFHGSAHDPGALEAVNVRCARAIVLLSKEEADERSDGYSFDVLHRLSEYQVRATVLAEAVSPLNEGRLRNAGADIVVRPIRFYPEIIVRALIAPGTEQILMNMFTIRGDECKRFDLNLAGRSWSDIVQVLLDNDIGTGLGYLPDGTDQVHCNPEPGREVRGRALYILVREGRSVTDAELAALLAAAPVAGAGAG